MRLFTLRRCELRCQRSCIGCVFFDTLLTDVDILEIRQSRACFITLGIACDELLISLDRLFGTSDIVGKHSTLHSSKTSILRIGVALQQLVEDSRSSLRACLAQHERTSLIIEDFRKIR